MRAAIVLLCSQTVGISLQEAIYGTKLLARLEAIKEAIDPDYMFDCYKCIGNNRAKGSDSHGSHDSGAFSMVEASAGVMIVLMIGSLFFA